MRKVLYEDKWIRIGQDYIELKYYYFPIGTTKIIPLSLIKTFYNAQDAKLNWLGVKGWGMGLSNIWWSWGRRTQLPLIPWDPTSQLIIEVEGHQYIRCGCTVADYQKVKSILDEAISRTREVSSQIFQTE
eukprot:TRINITY_DN733_c0_g1_i1.p1 TRINITY_DN733_c0_g1~~TRINITY_DN733_c0_g1_i1.p1  ORF type:complete len:130 (-),score=30.95 TRINITY_DN733_c0_g1_i1:171-560(-)